MTEPEWRRLNRANWDERVPIHLAAPQSYDRTALRAGNATLGPIVSAALGPVAGLKILHLQCHFGMDTLVLAQQGATVTGIDFSAPAIAAAEMLTAELGLADRAEFIVSDVYDVANVLPRAASFDRVLVSWGALCWLPDLAAWAKVVAHFLKPGGWLALADAHPFVYVFDDMYATPDGMPGWYAPYLGRLPMQENRPEDYADPTKPLANAETIEFLHPISDIIMALINAGLRLDRFEEHNSIAWKVFKGLVSDERGDARWPEKPWLPLSFSLRAVRPDAG